MGRRYLGQVLDVDIPEETGHTGYSVECRYKYIKSKDKFALSMRLHRKDIDDTFKIDTQEIDTQLISSEKDKIWDDIERIVIQASLSGFFDYYIDRFEYTYACADKGNNIFEEERNV